MQGERLGEETGTVTTQRVLPNPGGIPRMETTFRASGTLLGVGHMTTGTYASALRPDGTLYGEGQGLVMGQGGEMASWVGQGVGTLKAGGAVTFRGAVYYQTASAKWSKLNSVAVIYEYDVDAQGKTSAQFWEWK
jgi:hypothetical protein